MIDGEGESEYCPGCGRVFVSLRNGYKRRVCKPCDAEASRLRRKKSIGRSFAEMFPNVPKSKSRNWAG